MLLGVEHIWKYFDDDPILEDITFSVDKNDRIGIVGVNGCGKTTLLKIITDKISFDPTPGGEGAISVARDCVIGYLEQNSGMKSDNPIDIELRKPFHKLEEQLKRINELSESMTKMLGESLERASAEYARLSSDFELKDGYLIDVKINTILNGMGFQNIDRSRPISSLSGGERTRMALCKLLLEEPDLLILDEPTNHLDLNSTTWLEGYLKDYKGAVIVVSHNRYFLDRVCTRIIELEDRKIKCYKGNYTDFQRQKKADLERQEKLFEQQQQKIKELQFYIDKNRVSATSAKQAKNKQHMLDRIIDEGVEKPKKPKKLPKIRLEYDIVPPKEVFEAKNVDVSVGEGSARKTLIESLSFEVRRGEKVGIIGPNGIGKSSILKTIQNINPHEHGQIKWAQNVKIAYFDQKNELLNPRLTVMDEVHNRYPRLTDLEVRTVLGGVLLTGENVYKPVGIISGGEKTKLSFALMMLRRGNVLILDEPTNHLDSATCEVLEDALVEFDGTMILVSHDRYLLNKVVSRIIEVSAGGIKNYPGNYDKYVEAKELERIEAETTAASDAKKELKKQYRTKEQRSQDVKKKQDKKNLEALIEELETDIALIEEEIQKPEIAADYLKMGELCKTLEQKKQQLSDCLDRWVEMED